MNFHGLFFTFLLIVTLSVADETKSDDGIKVYKRLIPADVLRGMFYEIYYYYVMQSKLIYLNCFSFGC